MESSKLINTLTITVKNTQPDLLQNEKERKFIVNCYESGDYIIDEIMEDHILKRVVFYGQRFDLIRAMINSFKN
jgi:hypothetical protein